MRRLALLSLIAMLALASSSQAAPTLEEFGTLPTANAEPQDIVQGPDGNMWFTERGANKVGRISGTNPGTIDEFPIAAGGAQPDIIVVGPDAALWYTELGSNSVGRMPSGNPAGVVRFTGLGIIQARGIAAGPDGNLWVADAGGNQVIRVSPAGTAVGSAIALPVGFNARGITLGPDGNMWVGGFTSNSVARITTGATPALDPIAGFPVPAGTPIDVIGGSDGNVWYAGQGTTIGKVAPDGTATAFTSKGVDPFGVTLGPDGAVWFAEFQANAVGRVGTDGTTSEVTGMTASAGPRYVASGPGNTIWFTEETGNRVGRLSGIELPGGGGVSPPPKGHHQAQAQQAAAVRQALPDRAQAGVGLGDQDGHQRSLHALRGRHRHPLVRARLARSQDGQALRQGEARQSAAQALHALCRGQAGPEVRQSGRWAAQDPLRGAPQPPQDAQARRPSAHAQGPRRRGQRLQGPQGAGHRSSAQALAAPAPGTAGPMNVLILEVPGPVEPDQPNPNPPGQPEIPDPPEHPEPAVPAPGESA